MKKCQVVFNCKTNAAFGFDFRNDDRFEVLHHTAQSWDEILKDWDGSDTLFVIRDTKEKEFIRFHKALRNDRRYNVIASIETAVFDGNLGKYFNVVEVAVNIDKKTTEKLMATVLNLNKTMVELYSKDDIPEKEEEEDEEDNVFFMFQENCLKNNLFCLEKSFDGRHIFRNKNEYFFIKESCKELGLKLIAKTKISEALIQKIDCLLKRMEKDDLIYNIRLIMLEITKLLGGNSKLSLLNVATTDAYYDRAKITSFDTETGGSIELVELQFINLVADEMAKFMSFDIYDKHETFRSLAYTLRNGKFKSFINNSEFKLYLQPNIFTVVLGGYKIIFNAYDIYYKLKDKNTAFAVLNLANEFFFRRENIGDIMNMALNLAEEHNIKTEFVCH